jgi:hypothetical protein
MEVHVKSTALGESGALFMGGEQETVQPTSGKPGGPRSRKWTAIILCKRHTTDSLGRHRKRKADISSTPLPANSTRTRGHGTTRVCVGWRTAIVWSLVLFCVLPAGSCNLPYISKPVWFKAKVVGVRHVYAG